MSVRHYCTVLCFLAGFLRPLRAEPPNPVLEAISRLQAVENYSWTRSFETRGAPFTLAPASGWRTEGGHVTHETRATTSVLQTVTLNGRELNYPRIEERVKFDPAPYLRFSTHGRC
jgi:hypothetical protein